MSFKNLKKISFYQIHELKSAGIDFFREVVSILNSNNLEFWIEYGSLLGYVRHNDLIPWDSEFDLGVFDVSWNKKIEESLISFGFSIFHEPNRVKIHQPQCSIGMFSIDIHLHEIHEDETRILFGEFHPECLNIWSKLLWFFKIASSSNTFPIRYLSIMKSLSSKFNIMDPSILDKKFSISRGRYNHELSFIISIDGVKIDVFTNNIKFYRKLLLYILSLIPRFIIKKIILFIENKTKPTSYVEKYQNMPLSIYKELEYVNFCSVKVKAPLRKKEFLNNVYGSKWITPKINFSRSEMENILKI